MLLKGEPWPWDLVLLRSMETLARALVLASAGEELKKRRGPNVGRHILMCTESCTAGEALARYSEPGETGESRWVQVMSAETSHG